MKKLLTIISFFIFVKSFAQQQKDELPDSLKSIELDELVISTTRIERQLSSLPMPAQIITKEQIEKTNVIRLSDLLNEQSGIITVPDFGGGEGVQLQGMDAEHILIMIDGVPLIGRQAGTLDLSRLAVGNIKQLEIIKGASSSLYGSEALGGIINIITEKPQDGFKGNLNYRFASFNTHDANLDLGFRKKKLGVSLFANRYNSKGFDLNKEDELKTVSPFSNYTFQSKLNYSFSENTSLILSGRYYYQNQDYLANGGLKGESELDEWNIRAKFKSILSNKWKLEFDIYTTIYLAEEYLNESDGQEFSRSKFDQQFTMPELRMTFTPAMNHSFVLGSGVRNETLVRTDFLKDPEFNSQYVYFQYDGNLGDKLNIILGSRFDHHSEYASQFSPKAALNYDLSNKISLKASVGYGFKAPDFRQLYFDFSNTTVGYTVLGYNAVATRIPQLDSEGQISNIVVPVKKFDNRLKPESSISYNFGVLYEPKNNLSIELNLFRNNISNLIDTRVIANKTNGQNVFSYYNVHKVYTQGLEVNTTWKPVENLQIRAGYQLLFAKDKEASQAFEDGNVFARDNQTLQTFQLKKSHYFGLYNRSRHMANLKVFYNVPNLGLNSNIRLTYRSKYGLFDSNDNGYLDTYDEFVEGYFILDWAINKTVLKNNKVSLGIDNVLDFTDSQNISNIPGRIFYLKTNINF